METITCQGLDSIMAIAEMQNRVIYDYTVLNGLTFKGVTRPPKLTEQQRRRIRARLGNTIPTDNYIQVELANARLEMAA